MVRDVPPWDVGWMEMICSSDECLKHTVLPLWCLAASGVVMRFSVCLACATHPPPPELWFIHPATFPRHRLCLGPCWVWGRTKDHTGPASFCPEVVGVAEGEKGHPGQCEGLRELSRGGIRPFSGGHGGATASSG